MNVQNIDNKSQQCPYDTWTTREHLCLTSAVSQSGDQNWVAVSKTVRQLTTETDRPPDWYSNKNCAIQYTKLLEQIVSPKRKKEKSEGNLNETNMEILRNTLNKKRVEELKGVLEEERSLYQLLKRDILLLESSNQLDNRLHQFWDEMIKEQKAEDEETAKLKEFIREREEKIKAFQASKLATLKVLATETPKKCLSPIRPPVIECAKKVTDVEGSEDNSAKSKNEELKRQEEDITNRLNPGPNVSGAASPNNLSIKKSSSPQGGGEAEKAKACIELKSDLKEEESIKSNEDTMEDIKCDTSFEANIPLDYTSNLNADMKEQDILQDDDKKLLMPDLSEEHVILKESMKQPKIEETDLIKVETKTSKLVQQSDDAQKIDERIPLSDSDGRKGAGAGAGTGVNLTLDTSAFSGLESPGSNAERKNVKKDTKDEYEFDDDASRESTDMNSCYRDYMGRSDRRKFSIGESVSSPVVSESTPSSPASTNYGDDPEAEKLHRSWKRSIMLIWNDIAAHKNASIFLKPITEDKAPGYHSIVYRPIDLMTIKRSIENGSIRTTNDFQRDVMLMFLNAKMYNTTDQFVYQMAEHMMSDAVDTIEEFISAQMLAKVVETPQKTLRRETRESSAKRVGEDLKRKRDDKDETGSVKRRKI